MKSKIQRTAVLLALWCGLCAPVNTLGYGWGVERGRANEGDVARLLVDQLAVKRAKTRIAEAVSRPLVVERQRQLLGLSDGGVNIADLLDHVFDWWLETVMIPAEAIAENPAASCAEAQVAIQNLLEMMRQRQLLGISPDEDDKSAGAEKARALDGELSEMFNGFRTKVATRCREEALDECVMTGRFEQILQTELGLSRGEALLGGDIEPNFKWVDEALQQCAIYELHFVSTTMNEGLKFETVRDGKIKLKFELGVKLGDMLKGETTGAENPFLVSLKCGDPKWICSPGAKLIDPVRSRVLDMKLKHTEFYVDPDGLSKQRTVGEDKLSLEYSGGAMMAEVIMKITEDRTMTVPVEVGMTSFLIAHNRDSQGQGSAVRFERDKRGVYPVIFEFTYADRDRTKGSKFVWASDSTVFELIHKPDPKPIERKPDRPRKPLKPRPKIGSEG